MKPSPQRRRGAKDAKGLQERLKPNPGSSLFFAAFAVDLEFNAIAAAPV
jgi:hypothetical protein